MDATDRGAFCHSCQTEVIDFSAMTDREVIEYLEKNKAGCGRFRKDQLDSKLTIPQVDNGVFRWRVLMLGILPILAFKNAKSTPSHFIKMEELPTALFAPKDTSAMPLTDSIKITGKVQNELGDVLPYANVRFVDTSGKRTMKVTQADLDGVFFLNASVNDLTGYKIRIDYIGYVGKTISITNNKEQNYIITLKERDISSVGVICIARPRTPSQKLKYWFRHTFRVKKKH